MDKVVKLDAWRDRKGSAQKPAVQSQSLNTKVVIQTPEGEKELDDVAEATLRATLFAATLGNKPLRYRLQKLAQRNEKKIGEYRDLVGGYEQEQVEGLLKSAKDSDIQRRPFFYYALLDEADRRFIDVV